MGEVAMRTGGIALASALALSAFLAAAAFAVGAFDFAQLPTSPEPAGDGPTAVVMANLDGDADQDLAVADGDVGSVTILKNAGAGDFSPSGTETVGASPSSIAAADFDGDTDIDLAVTSSENND